ncbi:hypothetical protein V1477_006483 [Vespula maculifrons]|uniref:Uncharacterized protein n=1 Tax=Vespula maculifrons TaxID=7453 RepID=A0ABD2CJ68_VESMC
MRKSDLGPTFPVTTSAVLWTSTRELRNFRGCHPCNRLRETTTKSGLGPTFTVTSSVELWTSTRELKNLRGCHSCKLKCYIRIFGFERRQQSQVLDRPLQLLVQLSFGLRQENLEIFLDAFHASISEQLIQIYDGIFGFRLKCRVGILGFERRQQIQLSFGLRQENLEIFADAIRASTNEQLIQIYDGIFGFRLKCRVGILGFERRRQSQVLDRLLQLLVQLCFGLRRGNLEIFVDAIHTSINEQLIQIYNSVFGCRLKCRTQMQSRDTRFRETTTKSGLGPTFTVTTSVVLWTSTRELRNFPDAIHASINEQLIQIYDGIFGCRLKCRVGILDFDRRRQSRVLDRPFQLLLQLCFGLRRENIEIFADAIHAIGFERRKQSRVLDRPLQLLVQLSFGLRRENLEIFVDAIHASINEQLKCYIGIVGFERRQQSRVLDRPLQLLVQLSFGLRQENLEIFVDAFHASISEQFIQIYDGIFGFRLKCRIKMLYRESRLRETTTNSGLGLIFPVTTSVVLWTSTRELRNFRGCHPCKLKCYIGIVGFERRQQSRVLDRPLQLLVQLSFGLRQENLEIFVDAIHTSINGQLIQIYDGIFGFRLKCRVGHKCRVEIVAFERRRQSRVLDLPLQLLVQLCFGLRRENLEISADASHAIGFERRQQSRVLDRPLQLLVQLSFGLRQENLEIFADAIHASINEQLIQIYDGIFGYRLKCRVGILGFERRRQSRVLDRPLQLLFQLCFGLRRVNLEIFAALEDFENLSSRVDLGIFAGCLKNLVAIARVATM